ncbi:hypothetical protein [Limnobacter sp.]|uniref:hypothetical protein n=1 Tax=Limnobacter sp. TaxID=2003368 RepID=UPI0027334CB3|nr:hypothetical protein [Limnobacter sp.]MDP3273092.1 hypothetical protein [Limnobacter sp.]MDP3319018.1 hypothetical protein [Bosea sp. (in: a-proteobacteria)]
MRRVVRRRHSGFVNLFHSRRFGQLETESLLEFDFLSVSECDSGIQAIISQPVVLEWRDRSGRLHSHIPDYGVLVDGEGVIAEIKTDRDSRLTNMIDRTSSLKSALPAHGFKYEMYTESRIYQEPRYTRAQTLLAGLSYRPSDEDISRVGRCLSGQASGKEAARIIHDLNEKPEFIYNVYAMAIDGRLLVSSDNGPLRFSISKVEEAKYVSRI